MVNQQSANPQPTRFSELNELLTEFTAEVRSILGDDFVGAYLQGSFALGDADLASDCDFLVVVRSLSAEQEAALRRLHDQIPTRDGFWCGHLEGSYAQEQTLRTLDGLGTPWLYIDHGHREAQWSTHDNLPHMRWTLREYGVVLAGPPPTDFVAPVPADVLREEMRSYLPRFMDDLHSWATFDYAWVQRFAVTTYCRALYTLHTGRVASKLASLRWAMDTLDPRWHALLTQVIEDRAPFDPDELPRPGTVEETLAFAQYAESFTQDEGTQGESVERAG